MAWQRAHVVEELEMLAHGPRLSDEELVSYGKHWERVYSACSELEPQAVEVLAIIAERLVAGRKKYGDLNVTKDGRDWWAEFGEEMADGAVYAACKLLAGSKVVK